MGQKPSVSRLPNREDLLQKKGEGRVMISTIFSWLKDQASFQDLLLLGNPHKCTEYIFLTAEALKQVFDVLRVYPEKDNKGIIYFKKIDDLKGSQADYRPLCMQIAFFYIRIFQVFGALAMSVLDVDPVYTTAIPGQVAAVGAPPWTIGQKAKGGAIPEVLLKEPLKLLAPLLDFTEYDDYYKLAGTDYYVLKKMSVSAASGLFKVWHQKKGQNEATATFRLTRYQSTRYTLDIVDSKPKKLAFPTITFNQEAFSGEFKSEGKDLRQYVKKYFEDLEKVIGKPKTEGTGALDQPFVQAGLQAKHITDSFTKPPKAHCVARALQLLSTEGLLAKAPETAFTHMCDPVYFSENLSLPKADFKISDEIGIFVLNQLFYDTLIQSGAKMSGVAEEKYREYMKDMKILFEDLPISQRDALKIEAIAEIKNKLPKSCKTGQSILKTSHQGTIREVRKVAAQMLWFQIEHTAEVTKVLGKLFKIPLKRGDRVDLHPDIYKKGILGVNEVAAEARTLLMRYYKKCETLYRMGTTLYETQGNMSSI